MKGRASTLIKWDLGQKGGTGSYCVQVAGYKTFQLSV